MTHVPEQHASQRRNGIRGMDGKSRYTVGALPLARKRPGLLELGGLAVPYRRNRVRTTHRWVWGS